MENNAAMFWACIYTAILTAGAVILFLVIDYVKTHREYRREMGKMEGKK